MEPDRLSIHAQLESLHAKYQGTGNADTTREEWFVSQHRDSLASYLGHNQMLVYFAVATNESVQRTKYEFLEKMVDPFKSN